MEICGLDCCRKCSRSGECGGCEKCSGQPFGGHCIAADTILKSGRAAFEQLKKELISEINASGLPGLFTEELTLLNGFYVNLPFPLPNGAEAKFLNDSNVYLGTQVEREGSDRCYGVIAGQAFLLVCEYGRGGSDPVLVLYKKR